MKKKTRKENENEVYYVPLLVFFDEKLKLTLAFFFAPAGFEKIDPRSVCILACDSSETGFLDGMLLTFLEPKEPCIVGGGGDCGGGGSSIQRPSESKKYVKTKEEMKSEK